jgi:inosine-uridine nucleoside N-ribohydrolase
MAAAILRRVSGATRWARLALLWALMLSSAVGLVSSNTASAAVEGSCIVIDSDAGLDDFRAVAALAALGPRVPAQRIAAVVVTEGLARTAEGAGAMEAFLRNSGLDEVPVVQGIPPNPKRQFRVESPLPYDLPTWRENTERLNGMLPAPVRSTDPAVGDVAVGLRRHTEECRSISLLVIGPWTSFLRYAPDILERVERIIVQGRPYPDELGGEPAGFNCTYDLDSCYAAFDLLVGRQQRTGRRFRATWVDIPGGPEACAAAEPGVDAQGRRVYAFSPVPSWADELDRVAELAEEQTPGRNRGRVAREIAKLLRSNPAALGETSLWDDLAALYLMRPNLFAVRGGHVEPCVPAAAVRATLTEAMILQRP